MNVDMNGKKIKCIWLGKDDYDQRETLKSSEDVKLAFSATFHGDHDEFWIVQYDSKMRETARHNPRFLEGWEWE